MIAGHAGLETCDTADSAVCATRRRFRDAPFCNADFQICRIADFQVGKSFNNSRFDLSVLWIKCAHDIGFEVCNPNKFDAPFVLSGASQWELDRQAKCLPHLQNVQTAGTA
jgi:hypothetical protein